MTFILLADIPHQLLLFSARSTINIFNNRKIKSVAPKGQNHRTTLYIFFFLAIFLAFLRVFTSLVEVILTHDIYDRSYTIGNSVYEMSETKYTYQFKQEKYFIQDNPVNHQAKISVNTYIYLQFKWETNTD